jgi:hypothetical protein
MSTGLSSGGEELSDEDRGAAVFAAQHRIRGTERLMIDRVLEWRD